LAIFSQHPWGQHHGHLKHPRRRFRAHVAGPLRACCWPTRGRGGQGGARPAAGASSARERHLGPWQERRRIDLKRRTAPHKHAAPLQGADVIIENSAGRDGAPGAGRDALRPNTRLDLLLLPGFAARDRAPRARVGGLVARGHRHLRRFAHDDRGGPPVHTASDLSAFGPSRGPAIAAALHARETTGRRRSCASRCSMPLPGARIPRAAHRALRPACTKCRGDGQYRCADDAVHPVITHRRHMESFVRARRHRSVDRRRARRPGAAARARAERGLARQAARPLRDAHGCRVGGAVRVGGGARRRWRAHPPSGCGNDPGGCRLLVDVHDSSTAPCPARPRDHRRRMPAVIARARREG